MRWTILVLIMANLGYFAWGSFQASQKSYQVSSGRTQAMTEKGHRLVLLSEDRSASAVNVVEKRLEQNNTVQKKATLAKVKKQPIKQQPMHRSVQQPIVSTQQVRSNKVSGTDLIEGQSLIESLKEPSSQEITEAIEQTHQCLALGPFHSSDLIDQVQQRLFSLGIESRERANKNTQAADYWVHIPSLSSREGAIRLLRELQAQNIDSFVITQGELANGISLGLFSKYESAKSVRRRLINAGYPVEIKTLPQEPESWWLELGVGAEDRLDDYFWDELVKQVPNIKKAKKSCKRIASITEFL